MRRRTGCLAVACGAVLVLGLVIVLNWQMTVFVVGALLYRDPGPPQIANGLTIGQPTQEDGNRLAQLVGERLRRKFPAGTDENELRGYLQRQGFKPVADFMPADQRRRADSNTMIYWWGPQGPVCTLDLAVEWKSGPDRRLRRIDVRYGYGCM